MIMRYNAPRGTTLSESDNGELVMAADHEAAIDALRTQVAEVRAENEALVAGLLDPESVLVNMLRGNIAKLSPRGVCKVYGQVLNGEDAQHVEIARLRAELEAARGLLEQCALSAETLRVDSMTHAKHAGFSDELVSSLRKMTGVISGHGVGSSAYQSQREAINATPAPEALAEQGERQEAFGFVLFGPGHVVDWTDDEEVAKGWADDEGYSYKACYATPQPGPDVRGLAAALYQACGAYDMPEQILDVLSAAANGEPFTHMIAGLLPCVPPVESGVEGLVEALEHARLFIRNGIELGYIKMPDADTPDPAHDTLPKIETALAAHRQAQQGGSHD